MKQRVLLPRIKEIIKRIVPEAEVILYGSVARGEETEDSDIDLLILVDKDEEHLSYKEREKITYPLYDLEIETGVSISPKVKTRREWHNPPVVTDFYINVMNEGIVI